ncbi:GDSL esterase/lipase LIP-4 [Vitis vinifera]|uniref:GDSL esterase/lipase LIP-4 n=1 Tax=Vitis vinifera TaxID=29760 RepID=A0A438E1R6_VITVI|nr:GDSL esterase/lipase LIP-4 [Vitis vinifera]
MAVRGHGEPPYNYDPKIKMYKSWIQCCEEGSKHKSWDGVHHTEAATAFVASKILSAHYSAPPSKFDCFCNTQLISIYKPVIFNMGDSNSDTGSVLNGFGFVRPPPFGRLFHSYAFLLPDEIRGKNLSCYKDFVKEEDFKRALYMVDIGQNDLALAFGNSSYAQVVERIPTFIAEIEYAIVEILVHNTGPLGCLPQQLVNISRSSDDFDNHGCLKSRNNAAKKFNKQLKALCKKLRAAMKDATIVYVDIFAIKYDLIANAKLYGFENPLMVCCGHGGPPYNFDNLIQCGGVGFSVCEEGSKYVSWDGIHYTQLANQFVASKILSTNFSTPPLHFDFFCD